MPESTVVARMTRCVDRMLSATVPVMVAATTRRANVGALGVLALESLRQFRADPSGFGATQRTFNAAFKPFFQALRSDASGSEAAEVCLELYDVYRQRLARTRIENVNVPTYVAELAANVEFGACLDAMVRHSLLPRSVLIPAEEHLEVVYRRISSRIEGIRCFDPEELDFGPYPGDEIYFLTYGTLFDKTGHLVGGGSSVSDVDNGVRAGSVVELRPESTAVLIDAEVQNGPDHPWFPLSAMCSVTLVEHEHGDVERVAAAFRAGYSTLQVLSAAALGTTVGAIGAVVAIPALLVQLVIALDGDDELGSVVYRIDDVLTGPNRNEIRSETVRGSHLGNDYRYAVALSFLTEDIPGPAPTFLMAGPRNLRSDRESAVGHYSVDCAAQLRDICWTAKHVDIPNVTGVVLSQGHRSTSIRFEHYGGYHVQVTAVNDADGSRYSASIDTLFLFASTSGSGGSGGDRPIRTVPL